MDLSDVVTAELILEAEHTDDREEENNFPNLAIAYLIHNKM